MLTRLSLARDAEAIAVKRAISLLPFGEGCHSPFSKEARISSSSLLYFVHFNAPHQDICEWLSDSG